jgi:hypothetical protein
MNNKGSQEVGTSYTDRKAENGNNSKYFIAPPASENKFERDTFHNAPIVFSKLMSLCLFSNKNNIPLK